MNTDAERPRPPIVKRCAVCAVTLEAKLYAWAVGVVSPSGIEHIGCDDGVTACGHDATGDEWWWPA